MSVELLNVSFQYSKRKELALADVNLKIKRGEFVLILGRSGSGKSTLLRLLNGLIPHFYEGELKGRVLIDGMDTREHSVAELSRKVGLVFQNPDNQIVTLKVERELSFGLENLGVDPEEIERRVKEVIEWLRMQNLVDRFTDELSGGEKQLVAIGSILAMDPDVIALDEPTSELDQINAARIAGLVKRLNESGKTIIIAEHRLDLFVPLADRVVILSDGRVVLDGPPREVFKSDPSRYDVNEPASVRIYRLLKDRIPVRDEPPLTVKEFVHMMRCRA